MHSHISAATAVPLIISASMINMVNWFLFSLRSDSQRSHLSSFTMKLKDKFHSPKIKRTPSKKGKQLQPEPTAKSTEKPANKVCVFLCVCVAEHICVYCGKYTFFSLPCSACSVFRRRLFSCFMCYTPLCLCVRGFLCWFPQPPSQCSSWLCYSRCLNLYRRELNRATSWMTSTTPS